MRCVPICPSVVIARKLSKIDSALWNTTKEVRTADSFAAFNPPPDIIFK